MTCNVNGDETSQRFFNPFYFRAKTCFKVKPKEFIKIYFDGSNDYSWGSHKNYDGYLSCLKKQQVFVLLQNSCNCSSLMVNCGTRLMDILIMPDIKSCILPTSQSYIFSHYEN